MQPRKHLPQSSPTAHPKDRKRPPEDFDPLYQTSATASQKRARRSLESLTDDTMADQGVADQGEIDPIIHWTRTYRWPEEYAKPSNDNISYLVARKSSIVLRWKRSEAGFVTSSFNTPSDQKPREEKSAPYRDLRYVALLAAKGSYMDKSDLGVKAASKALCHTLLEEKQTVPQDSLFRDDIFESTCRNIMNRDEARVIQDVSRLIVPSVETLTIYGAINLWCLIESVNEGWNNSIPVTYPRPQPDYSVGFRREAFTEDQLSRLSPFVGDFIASDQSFFMATYYMYFPFLTCEVKCGSAALDIADRQNAHSMTVAVRAVVELFRLVKREQEIDREILGFSISHDHQTVRIYSHYPVITRQDTKFYRHPIIEFDFANLDGKEKWTAYKFTKSVYNTWMPSHFERICSAINQIPSDLNFGDLDSDLRLIQQSDAPPPSESLLEEEIEGGFIGSDSVIISC